MKQIVCAVIAASMLAGGPAASRARAEDGNREGSGPEEGGEHGRHFEKMLKEKLGLTDDQAAKLKAAWESEKAATKPLRDAEREGARKLEDQVRNLASDQDIQKTLDQLDSNRKAMMAEHEKVEASFASVLKPSQRAKMRLMMMGRMKRGRRGHEGPVGDGRHDHDD